MIRFRQATKNDSQSIKNIAKRVIKRNYLRFLGMDAVASFIESGMSDKEIDDGLADCVLMVCNEQIIGFAITKEDALHLIMMDVPFQTKGHGSALLAHMEERLFSGFKKIRLQTFQENVSAVRFYQKNGWVIAGQESMPELDRVMLQFEKAQA